LIVKTLPLRQKLPSFFQAYSQKKTASFFFLMRIHKTSFLF